MWIALLVLAGFLVGGTWSFARQKRYGWAAVLGVLAVMSALAAFQRAS